MSRTRQSTLISFLRGPEKKCCGNCIHKRPNRCEFKRCWMPPEGFYPDGIPADHIYNHGIKVCDWRPAGQ